MNNIATVNSVNCEGIEFIKTVFESLETNNQSVKDDDVYDIFLKIVQEKCNFEEIEKIIKPIEKQLSFCWNIDKIFSTHNCKALYFIKNEKTGLVKIGKTENISARIKQLGRVALQLGIEPHDLHLITAVYLPMGDDYSNWEIKFHKRFKTKRKIGEWFALSYTDIFECLEECFGDGLRIVINEIPIYSNTNDWMFEPLKIIDSSAENYAEYLAKMYLSNCKNGVPSIQEVITISDVIEKYKKYGGGSDDGMVYFDDDIIYDFLKDSIPDISNKKIKDKIWNAYQKVIQEKYSNVMDNPESKDE